MIKLKRSPAPDELDAATVLSLTAQFAQSGDAVWNQNYIRSKLLEMSASKCAYCETSIDEESKYMEVEHFYSKSAYPSRVVDWNNLLPSCKRCNVQKGSHDVNSEGMITNPCNDNPTQHLKLSCYRLKGRDDLGRQTVETLYLNDSSRLVRVRLKIGEAVLDALDKIREYLTIHLNGAKNRYYINKVIRSLDKLFDSTEADKAYSATAATVLLGDDDFSWVKNELLKLGMWNQFVPREAQARLVALL